MFTLQEATNNPRVKAFIEVAQILEPTVDFNRCENIENTDDGGTSIKTSVMGVSRLDNTLVIVNNESHPTEGEQIVARHFHPITRQELYKRSVWYFAFNWTALINKQKVL